MIGVLGGGSEVGLARHDPLQEREGEAERAGELRSQHGTQLVGVSSQDQLCREGDADTEEPSEPSELYLVFP